MGRGAREIKFRAWDVGAKRMVSWEELSAPETHTMSWCYDNEHWRLMQFTGLHDKNGKEIWEGDILKLSRYWSDHFGIERTEVFFLNAEFQFNHSHVKPHNLSIISDECEVLGNIHENPDLLNPRTEEVR